MAHQTKHPTKIECDCNFGSATKTQKHIKITTGPASTLAVRWFVRKQCADALLIPETVRNVHKPDCRFLPSHDTANNSNQCDCLLKTLVSTNPFCAIQKWNAGTGKRLWDKSRSEECLCESKCEMPLANKDCDRRCSELPPFLVQPSATLPSACNCIRVFTLHKRII